MRFLFTCCLFAGSVAGFYLGRPADPAPPHAGKSVDGAHDTFDYRRARRIDARRAWQIYFDVQRESRSFVDDPKPHPFLVAAAFATVGTAILGIGACVRR